MQNLKSYKSILSEALKATKLNHKSQMLFIGYPNLNEACENLAGTLTNFFPGENGPLLHEALVAAFDAYDRTAKTNESPTGAFLINLVECAPLMLAKRLTAKHGGIAWIPFKEPADSFVKRHGEAGLGVDTHLDPELAQASRADAMFMLASQILTLHDFKYVREYLTQNIVSKAA